MEELNMTPMPTAEDARNTAKVVVRHSAKCKAKAKGSDYKTCDCPKSLLIYDAAKKKNAFWSANTRVWAKAEKMARELRESWDPQLAEIKRLTAEKERGQIALEKAIALYIQDQITQHGDNGTVSMVRSMFGHVDVATFEVKSDGRFFEWIKTLPLTERPVYIADITPTHLTQWRAGWDFSGTTPKQRWGMVKSFFNFCEIQGWITDSPARKLKSLKGETERAIFSDDQYARILDNVYVYEPENIPTETKKNWQKRLEIFLELLRWTGMDLIDAVKFSPDQVNAEGILTYKRQKTGVQAIIPLEERIQILLRDIPVEQDTVNFKQPFRTDSKIASDVRCWAHRLENLFKLAGVTQVKTDKGNSKKPYPKILRHTFAVGELKNGVPPKTVAMMLGHTSSTTTEEHYLPFVPELSRYHIDTIRERQHVRQERQEKERKQSKSKVLRMGRA
jgi:site-specific recombinase XerD